MTITAPAAPPLPSLNDPANFNTRALALFSWVVGEYIPWLETLAGVTDDGEINGIPIGQTVAAKGKFTTLLADSLGGGAVQSGAADTAAGKLLLANAYGWGGQALSVPNDNLDDITVAGNYFLTTAVLSASTLPSGYGFSSGSCLLHFQFNADNSAQFLVAHGTGYAFVRINDGGVWQPWSVLYSNTSLLGTVSQSGGVPTGAVIERGSNANGEYVRFADGTQICTHEMTLAAPNVAHGQIYADAGATTWTYPASFISGATVSAHNVDVGSCFFAPYGNSNGSCGLRVLRAVSSAAAPVVRLMATGRWF